MSRRKVDLQAEPLLTAAEVGHNATIARAGNAMGSTARGHDVANSAGPTELQPGAASSYAIAFHAPDCGKQFRIELLPSTSLNEV